MIVNMMKNGIIDFHTHAFPDEIAPRAMKKLLAEAPGAQAFLDGTITALSDSMKRNSISHSVVCCIATTPEQFTPIFNWCRKVQTEKIIMFPSIHPADTKWKERISQIKEAGFKGVKMHPYYQDFRLDEDRMLPIYEELTRCGLMLVVHTGYDIAFARDDRADCHRILKVTEMFPQLKFVTTHLGAWQQWDDVERVLAGKHIYMELSWSLEYLSAEQARRIILAQPADCVLFGTDSPWTDQGRTIELFKALKLPQELEKRILRDNAITLLGLCNKGQ
jgi:predicted TIM-barrel fold metal-dependent hydrolase